jgi:hypothetical protein
MRPPRGNIASHSPQRHPARSVPPPSAPARYLCPAGAWFRKLGGEVGAHGRPQRSDGRRACATAMGRLGGERPSSLPPCPRQPNTHTHSHTSSRAIAALPPTISCPTTPLPEAPPKCWRGSRSSSSAAVRGEHALKLLDHLCCELVARLCAGEQGGHALHLPAGAAVGAGHQAVLGEDGGQHLQ